jgi:hypothetical protein
MEKYQTIFVFAMLTAILSYVTDVVWLSYGMVALAVGFGLATLYEIVKKNLIRARKG